jgi:transcriptional regulator with XRE-family HTH domain
MTPKVSQEDLGTALGVSFQQIQKYEKGVNRLSAAMMVRLP